ncbi:MAG TPA: ABC transporter permease subunit [Armatimonadetes bacterium]|nr:ABC transporter permease subunit [Armatimonadota bacterium]
MMEKTASLPLRSTRINELSFWTITVVALLTYLAFLAALVVSATANINVRTFMRIACCPEIRFALKLSMLTATITTFFAMSIAIPSAYALSRYRGPGQVIIDTLLDLPIVLPPIALGFLLLVFLQTNAGEFIQKRLVQFVFEVPGIILAQFAVASGFAMRVLKSTFDSLNPRYEDVARTLGFSKWQAFARIVLPLSRNGLIAGTVLTWARCIGEFGATIIVAGAFEMKTEVLSIAIFLKWQMAQISEGLTVTLLLILISLAALAVFKKIGGRVSV